MKGEQLLGQLMSDLRFSSVQINGDEYWLLSECEFANDLIYNYMQSGGFSKLPLSDIPKLLLEEYELEEQQYRFAPEIDQRFHLFVAAQHRHSTATARKLTVTPVDCNMYYWSRWSLPLY